MLPLLKNEIMCLSYDSKSYKRILKKVYGEPAMAKGGSDQILLGIYIILLIFDHFSKILYH